MGLAEAGRGVLQFVSDFNDPQKEAAMLRRLVDFRQRNQRCGEVDADERRPVRVVFRLYEIERLPVKVKRGGVIAERIVDEFRSVVVFSELLQRMGECEAPFDALCAVHGLIGDELRHAALCARVASWFGPASRYDVDLAGLALPLAPGILRMLRPVIAAASARGLPVSLCGDIASHPLALPVLIGLGLRSLSMPASEIPLARAICARLDLRSAEDVAKKALDCATEAEVRRSIVARLGATLGDLWDEHGLML
jgi:hypothetical protein